MDGDGLREIIQDTNIEAFTVSQENSLLYYSKGDAIMARPYFNNRKTYELTKVLGADSVRSLAVAESTLYYLVQDKGQNNVILGSCGLGDPSPSGKCENHRIRASTGHSHRLKAFNFYEIRNMVSPCQYYNGGCEHFCVLSARFETGRTITCQCQIGWELNADMKTCSPIKEYLVYVRGKYLRGRVLDLDKGSFVDAIEPKRLILNSLHPVQFDFNVRKEYLVYIDGTEMWRLDLRLADGQQRQNLLELASKYEMLSPTVDWVANQLYYVRRSLNSADESYIMVRQTDYSDGFDGQKIVYRFPKTQRPRAMVFDPNLGYMFFTVYDETAKKANIYRTASDGSELIQYNINEADFSVGDIALGFDHENSRLYWFNQKRTEVQYATSTGTSGLTMIDVSRVKEPTTIDVRGDWMYIGNG